jgi:hypothetical protein
VGLRADTVDGDTGGPPRLDVLDHGLGLGVVGRVEVVVVDVQLGSGVSLAGGLEGDLDEVLAEDVVEDGGAEAAVLLEHLVDDVPGVDLALVLGQELGDVVLHDAGQGGLVLDGRNPGGQLAVPDGGVTTDQLLVVGGELDSLVGGAQVELALAGLSSIPLHAALIVSMNISHCRLADNLRVLGGDLTEVGLDDGGVLGLVEPAGVRAGTEVLLALLDHSIVDALRSLALEELDGLDGRSSKGKTAAQQESGSKSELHGCGCKMVVDDSIGL